jgi:hypothetical protein
MDSDGNSENGACRIATVGYPDPRGYVTLEDGTLAHRYAWEYEHGRIPEGMVIHHVCENKWCVNVDHLQLISPSRHMALHQRNRVSDNYNEWVRFLVRDLDARTLKLIRKDALRRKLPVQDWMRTILCRHYELDCEKTKRFSAKRAQSGHARTFLLRLQPALWQAVRDDADESGRSMQVIVREILETPYRKVEA